MCGVWGGGKGEGEGNQDKEEELQPIPMLRNVRRGVG